MLVWFAIPVAIVAIVLIARTARPQRHNAVKVAERKVPPRLLETRPLPPIAQERYAEAWRALQSRFANEPEAALRDTDRLLQGLMQECGYPTGDFGRVTEEVSVEQVEVLDNYRVGHRITVKGETSMLESDEIARAVDSFRAAFERLASVPIT